MLGWVSLLMDVSSELIHSLLPVFMVASLGASMFIVGVVEGVAESAALIMRVFSGAISDYFGKRKGLAVLGYLDLVSAALYEGLGNTWANITLGTLSAIVDNIPIMYAVLQMDPAMDHGQWLLITLTCGVGGSMLSVGSAAGVALMGQSRGMYTFFSHLRWTWAIALGYALSVLTHLWWNADLFTQGPAR